MIKPGDNGVMGQDSENWLRWIDFIWQGALCNIVSQGIFHVLVLLEVRLPYEI